MAAKRRKRGANLGQSGTWEIHFFLPGLGFRAKFYPAESKEKALEALKREFPTANAFWIGLARGKALAGPRSTRYVIWWKHHGEVPHRVFVFDQGGALIGSLPPENRAAVESAWNLAQKRSGHNSLEEVDPELASLIGNEILIRNDRFRDQAIRDWQNGKFDDLSAELDADREE